MDTMHIIERFNKINSDSLMVKESECESFEEKLKTVYQEYLLQCIKYFNWRYFPLYRSKTFGDMYIHHLYALSTENPSMVGIISKESVNRRYDLFTVKNDKFNLHVYKPYKFRYFNLSEDLIVGGIGINLPWKNTDRLEDLRQLARELELEVNWDFQDTLDSYYRNLVN